MLLIGEEQFLPFYTAPWSITACFQVCAEIAHGQPMILVPGLSFPGETWDTTVEHFKDRFECHVLTLAGFASVLRVPAPVLDRVRDGIAEYIRQKHLDHPVIVGHSLWLPTRATSITLSPRV